MKNLFLVFALILIISCQKRANENLRPEQKTSKQEKFFEVKDAPKYAKQLLVKLRTNNQKILGRFKYERVRTKAMERVGDNGFYKIDVDDVEKELALLKSNPEVEYVVPNYTRTTQGIPDDTYYGDLWGLHKIGTPAVWQAGNFGSKTVYVAVLDESIFPHDDLCGNIWVNPYEQNNGIDDDGNGYIDDFYGWDWFNNSNEIYKGWDGSDHATHVAGTIGAIGGNQRGVVGISPNVVLISLKFLTNWGFDDGAIKAIDYAIDLKKRHGINLRIITNSWGGSGYNQLMIDAIKRAEDADILMPFAAGNSAQNSDVNPMYPAAYPNENIISVGASDWGDLPASFSNYGAVSVDLFAPGTGILSTVPSTSNTSAYAYYGGTSMATPHVAAAAALYLAAHPQATFREVKQAILNSVDPVASLNGKCVTGGRLNISSFVTQTAEVQQPIYPCPTFTPDITPPPTPQNLRIVGTSVDIYGCNIKLQWDTVGFSETKWYVIWMKKGSGAWDNIGAVGGTWIVNIIRLAKDEYRFYIVAKDDWGNKSGQSNEVFHSFLDTPPSPDTQPPTLNGPPVLSDIGQTSITVGYPTASDNVGVTGYSISYKRESDAFWQTVETPATSYVFNNLSSGTTYQFYYQAKDSALNWSVASSTVAGTTLTPPPPPPPSCSATAVLDGTSSAFTVNLNWVVNSNCAVQSTRLERKSKIRNNITNFSPVAFDPVSPYQDVVTESGLYTYRLSVMVDGKTYYSNEKPIRVNKK